MTDTPGLTLDKQLNSQNTTMTDLKRDWKFRVKTETTPGETVFVVGNCDELGNWMNKNAVQLSTEGITDNNLWVKCLSLPGSQEIQFRYFVGVIIEPDGARVHSKQIIVRRWETNVHPRIIGKDRKSNVDENVVSDADIFGVVSQKTMIERGWLTSETVVQLKLFKNPLQLWKKRYEGKKISLKVTPVNLSQTRTSDSVHSFAENIEESMDTHDQTDPHGIWPLTEIAVMHKEQRELKLQQQFGHIYNGEKFALFQISVLHLESVAYLIDFYVSNCDDREEDPPTHIGFSYILPSILQRSEGQAIVPITSTKHRPIGQLTVEYLVVLPIKGYECDMHVSFARMWKPSWQGLDVGHRGLGTSFKLEIQACSDVRENTIASLKTAALHGADLVEFDVQLTKDLIPVLYHDFHVCIAMKRKKQLEEHDMLELPMKDLTLEQLQLLKAISSRSKVLHFCEFDNDNSELGSCRVYHVAEGRDNNPRFFDEDLEDHQPFPTLQHALETVDQHVGFNVEIKWTMQLQDGSYELYHPFDLNMYLDTVLKVILQHAGNRKIVFSCFHPDICTMLRLKQNKYPVMFLTQGITTKYPPYHDPRTQSIPMAVHYAVSAGILGINVHTEDLLRDSSQVKLATDAGLIIFCWGDDNNNSSTIKHLKNLGLHAIIYDKIDKFGMKEVKESIFLVEAREAQNDLLNVAKNIEAYSAHPSSEIAVEVGTTMSALSVSTHNSSEYFDSMVSDAFENKIKEMGKETSVN